MNTKIENLRTMEQKNLKKAAVIAAGTAAMMGMNTTVQAREAENTESANEQFDTASVSQQDQIVQDIETAQNDVVQAEKELAPVEQEYTQAQDDFNQAQSEADQATQNLDNAHQAAQEVIDQEEGRLKDEIKKAEESIQTNEETIESLTKENEQKEQEVKEAKDSIVQKEAELEQAKAESDKVSDAQIQNAQATFQDALDQANQAKAELEEAELQILSKNGQIQKVRTDLEKTQSGYNQAVAVHEKAQNEYKTAKEKADTAQKVYDAIINGTSVDKELLEKARQDVTNAQEALTAAYNELEKAKKAVSDKKADIESLQARIKELEDQLTIEQAKEKEIEALRQKVADKEKEVASKQNALTDLQNKKATLDSKVSAKQNELNNAKTELSQKESNLQSLRDRLTTVKDMIANPDKYEAAVDPERQSTVGFFNTLGENGQKQAKNLMINGSITRDGVTYNTLDLMKLGQKGDPTSLENIKRSIELIKEANKIRKQEGKEELLIDLTLMARAQESSLMSAQLLTHSRLYTIAENLAFGYGDTHSPFEGWYVKEGKLAKEHPEWLDTSNPNWSRVGHYYNLLGDYNVTGFAVNQYGDYGSTFVQHFNKKNKFSGIENAFTVEEFERLFNAYYEANKVEEIDVDALNKEVNTINSKITETAKAVNSLKNKVNVLTNELNTLKTEKTTAESNVTKANQALRTVQSELSAMQGQFDQAIQALHAGDAQTSLNTAYSQLESAKGELTDLERKEEGREFKVNQAQTILANAQKVLKDLEPDLETATKNLASAQAEAEVKKQALNTARQSMDTLENAWKELQKTLEQAIQKREALNMEYANAKAKVDRAENVLKTAGEEVERYRAICQAVTDIQAEIDTLKEQIDATTGKMETNKETIVNVLNENAVLEESIPGFNEALSILNAYRQPLTMAYAGQSYTIDFDEKGAYKELADQIDQIASLYQTKAQKQGALDSAKAVLDALTPDYSAAKEKVAQARKTLAHARQALKDYLASLMQTNEGAQLETSLVSEQRINHPVSHAPELEVNGRMVQRVEQPFEKLAETKGSQHKEKKADKEASDTVKPSQSNPTIPLTAGGLVVAGGVAAFLAKTRKKKEA